MEIVNIKISELKNAEYNPRQADEKQVNDLKESIKRFGMVDPIIVNNAENRKNVIVGGHFRVKVAKDMGILEVPCIFVNIPDIKKEQELNLRLNKNTGDWDWSLLANLDEELLKDVGFDSEELDKAFETDLGEDDFDAEAEVAKITEPVSKLGEVYQLGKHRLMCGDSTKKEDVEKLMNGQKADMAFCDPPYNIGYDYWDYLDKKEAIEYKNWCEKWFRELAKMVPIILLTIGQWNMKMWFDIEKPLGIISWISKNKTSGSKIAYFSIWEPILVYAQKITKKRGTDFIDKDIVRDELSLISDVEQAKQFIKENADIMEVNNKRQKGVGTHKCPKQVGMLVELFSRYSGRGELLVDLFLGSGSTLIASEQTGRVCYGMELDPKYCDVIRNRYKRFKENQL